ncbi:MAG: ABC-ATPase domain-containing protein [Lachnospiraceae bacterium]|nr:ABC-ATPase domain-containing protein [Lachnospiraceae bacterium]
MRELQSKIRGMDHRGYPAYKGLKGKYRFNKYELSIDHVQGDPFASPSSLSVRIAGKMAGIPEEYYKEKHRRVALEDFLLRGFAAGVEKISFQAKGSGKSGLVAASRPGQEIMERSACQVNKDNGQVLFRFAVGFPARGRSIAAEELEKILFRLLPPVVEKAGLYGNLNQKALADVVELADDQKAIRDQMKEMGLVAFVADGSVLPRESGVSERPMRNAVEFISPDSMKVVLQLPHKGECSGMGIPQGVTLIVGGGYHGKSTLLKTLEKTVYPHIIGDGREYAATDESGMKIRAEDGRSVCEEDISPFIRNLPNGKDTACFSTLDASGSTSQAANTVEAVWAGSHLLLIDEDTSATNFMIRDELMEQVIAAKKEPIVPFIKRVGQLYQEKGISTILVVGSCGAFFHVADKVIQMDRYLPKEITEEAKEAAKAFPLAMESETGKMDFLDNRSVYLPKAEERSKIKVMGTDGFSFGKKQVDLRYLEQITDSEQMLAIAKALEYLSRRYGGKKIKLSELVDDVESLLRQEGISGLCEGNVIPNMAMPRRMEIAGCINRYIKPRL